jgi:hypothetical protein
LMVCVGSDVIQYPPALFGLHHLKHLVVSLAVHHWPGNISKTGYFLGSSSSQALNAAKSYRQIDLSFKPKDHTQIHQHDHLYRSPPWVVMDDYSVAEAMMELKQKSPGLMTAAIAFCTRLTRFRIRELHVWSGWHTPVWAANSAIDPR